MNPIINPGDPNCRHVMKISPPARGEHEIGTCSLCGRRVDYTLLQSSMDRRKRAEIDKPVTLLAPGMTMGNIVKSRTGGTRGPSGIYRTKIVGGGLNEQHP